MRIDIHVHTRCSDGLNSVEEMVEQAKRIGLDGLAVTDHNTVEGGLRALRFDSEDFRVIPGMEVSSLEGHILVLNVSESLEKYLSAGEVIERAHELGGIAIAAHPYDVLRGGVGDLICKLDFDAVEVSNGHTLLTSNNAERIADEAGLRKVGGSDAHSVRELGSVLMVVGNDPIESILAGRVEIVSQVDKLRVIRETINRRMCGLL
ncbi:MAG: CehA/McbA family metallohydrolase [Candidatus Altiarchaeota archaeon]|nr:CehA/McbA family metallohydrolase [Candidatus Altiarchaeota archaeon]